MKYLISVLLMLLIHVASGQDVNSISKIVFDYGKGGNSWGRPGVYGQGETIEISATDNLHFTVTKHVLVNFIAGVNGKNHRKDTVLIDKKHYPFISRKIIDSLSTQLKTTKDNFNSAFIKPQLKTPSKKQILKVADDLDKRYFFEDQDEAEKNIARIQDFARLDSFINLNKPNPNLEFVIMDASDRLDVEIIRKKDTVRYRNEFHQLLGQPFHQKHVFKGTANLEINTIIASLIPKSSLLYGTVKIDALTEKYIKWYIENVL